MRVTKKKFSELADRLQQTERFCKQSPQLTSASTALAATLWYLGNLSSQREIAERFDISQGHLCHLISDVVDFLCSMSGEVIQWPGFEVIKQVEGHFRSLANFPGVMGALDGCHIPILAPEYCQADYLDRNHNHSVNLMAVCDSEKKFTYCYAGYPGSVHDQRVFGNSSLGTAINSCPAKFFPSNHYHIIGDSAFQLHEHVMVPYKDTGHLTVTEINYNRRLSQTRRVIENAFGLLKGRFRRLKRMECALSRVSSNVTACCILHNLTLGDDTEESLLASEMLDCRVEDLASYEASGLSSSSATTSAAKRKRDALAHNLM